MSGIDGRQFELVPVEDLPPQGQVFVNSMLQKVRPVWRAKELIARVERLLSVDPSSACQRLLNAAVYDLRDKIVVAGLDIAKEAAEAYRLPVPDRAEAILDTYNVQHVLDLSYRMGLLTKAEWRMMRRVYDIRRDLEHEDAEYEATPQDLYYIFTTCIDVVLSRDPVDMIRIEDVKELVEASTTLHLSLKFVGDYASAPPARQDSVLKYLMSVALNNSNPSIVRANAEHAAALLGPHTSSQVKIGIAKRLQQRVGHRKPEAYEMRLASAVGCLAYLSEAQRREYFATTLSALRSAGYSWRAGAAQAPILEEIEEVRGLACCPADIRREIVVWMVLCYIGEPGGYGDYGRNRSVFYSNAAAPLIARIIKTEAVAVGPDVVAAATDTYVQQAVRNQHVARRFDALRDMVALAPPDGG